jgi:hypothetical protein
MAGDFVRIGQPDKVVAVELNPARPGLGTVAPFEDKDAAFVAAINDAKLRPTGAKPDKDAGAALEGVKICHAVNSWAVAR